MQSYRALTDDELEHWLAGSPDDEGARHELVCRVIAGDFRKQWRMEINDAKHLIAILRTELADAEAIIEAHSG